jgi:four helix bundle suffix protein
MPAPEPLIPLHGGYRNLKSFQRAQLAYDVTVRFVDRYIDWRSRTRDQMVQAARSGVQNIAEGSRASGTSKKTELKLTNVARASLEELRLDYEDFLRHRRLPIWAVNDPRRFELVAQRCATADAVAAWVKRVHDREAASARGKREGGLDGLDGPNGLPPRGQQRRSRSIPSIQSTARHRLTYAEIAANAALILIGVACALLDRQLAAQAAAFEREGGFTERLHRVRSRRIFSA